MIDWQIIVEGKFPSDWDEHKDGCWFPDFDIQRFLLPYFDVGDQPIDEYGATNFDANTMKRLRTHLEWQRAYLEARGTSWVVTETSDGVSASYEFQRDVILEIIDRTVSMVDLAIELNGQLVFRGD
jgi:hypothetical protein